MRSSRGEGGAGVVREKLEAEGGDGNCERLCSLIISAALSLIPVLFKNSFGSPHSLFLFNFSHL
jgi:hypothetical protein